MSCIFIGGKIIGVENRFKICGLIETELLRVENSFAASAFGFNATSPRSTAARILIES